MYVSNQNLQVERQIVLISITFTKIAIMIFYISVFPFSVIDDDERDIILSRPLTSTGLSGAQKNEREDRIERLYGNVVWR